MSIKQEHAALKKAKHIEMKLEMCDALSCVAGSSS
jgi:hypothetical protein